jgi:WD40 repeat protein/transcriptional regulator with XRE-family HTH domain
VPSWPDDVSNRAEFAIALTFVRERAGLTVRELARRLDTPPATLGGYFSGRHIPSTAQLPLLRSVLAECGVTDGAEVDAWVAALGRARSASDRRTPRPPTPYRGLRSFEPDDAGLFFGRDADTDLVLSRLKALRDEPGPSNGVLAVIGPSGSGKSSLLRAGLVAAIHAGRLDPGGPRWTCSLASPGADPVGSFTEAVEEAETDAPHVVVLDQFEEIFTAVRTPAERVRLFHAIAARPPRVLVVLGMRADFYALAAAEPLLLASLQHAQVLVGPLSRDHVREAIVRPAQSVGATVEDGLVDLILSDLAPHDAAGYAHDAGALPLLSHALHSTWDRAVENRLTIADYRAAGGIDGAVQRTADDLYRALTSADQELARRVFVRLVNLNDDVAVTRRRISPLELAHLGGAGASVDDLLERFVEQRLITTHANSVEITHEALLSAWPRLRFWLDADRAGLRLHRQLTEAANTWRDMNRDPTLLLSGTRLDAAAEWMADEDHRGEANQLERDFVEASGTNAAAEQNRERRRTRRLRRLLAAVGVLAVVAAGLAAYALRSRSIADQDRQAARAARDNALSRQVAFQARELARDDPTLAEQLALVAYRVAPTDAAKGAVIDESAQPPVTRLLGAQGPTAITVSNDGRRLAVGHADDGSVHLYSTGGRSVPAQLGVVPGPGKDAQVFAVAFSPDGSLLATGGELKAVQLWNLTNPAHPRALGTLGPAFDGDVQSIAISPDGHTLAAASAGPHPVLEWDITDPSAPKALPSPRVVPAMTVAQSVAFSPNGSMLAAGGKGGAVLVWPTGSSGTAVPRSAASGVATVNAVRFGPQSDVLYTGDSAGVVTAWKTAGKPRALHTLKGDTNSQVNVLAASPDNSRVIIGRSDGTVQQFDNTLAVLDPPVKDPGPITGLTYSPDGRTVYAAAADGTLRLWPADHSAIPVNGTVFNVVYSSSGKRLAVVTNGDAAGVQLWDLQQSSQPRRLGPLITLPAPYGVDGAGAMTADGSLVAAANTLGQVGLWDTSDPEHPKATVAPFKASSALVEGLAFNPDGTVLGVASDDATISLWDVHDPMHPRRLSTVHGGNLMLSLTFSPDGHLLAGANADETAPVWDISNVTHPVRVATLGGFKSYVYGVAFSPDGRKIAVSSADHTTRLWTIGRPSHPQRFGPPLIGPTDYAYSVAFNRTGSLLAVASNDHTVSLYDPNDASRQVPIETLHGLSGPAFIVAFSPDGKSIIGGGRAEAVAEWSLDPRTYASRLCPIAGDPITRQEWDLYVPGARYEPPCQ